MSSLDVSQQRTALYRFFNVAASPLYFGITSNTKTRFAQHAREKDWWPEVDHARTRIVWFDTREQAETAELAAIRDERPEHNIVTSDEYGCARFLPGPIGQRWGRPKWEPSEQQRKAVEAMVELHRRQQELEAEYKAALAKLADPEGRAVPIAHLAERIGVERKTVYRHLGRSMT